MSIIELNNISKVYKQKEVLKNFSLKIEEGEMVAITGKSGKGKTTILNIIGLLESYNEGTLRIDGEENIKVNSRKAIGILREKISYLFQNFALIDEETVEENLKLSLKYVKATKKEKIDMMSQALKEVGLEGFEKRKVFELSGGEQQRVALARIILKPSKIILADEPTGSLDDENLHLVLDILKSLNKKGKTIVIVTHDLRVANECNNIINI